MIWKQRNHGYFSNKRANPNLAKMISKQAMEFLFCVSRPNCKNQLVVKRVSWVRPDLGWFKLNTDGASRGSTGSAAGGGLIRDEVGNWVIGFSRKIGRTDSFAAEMWALCDGLQLCQQMSARAVLIKLDAKALVDVLNNFAYSNAVISPLLDDCKFLISQFPQVRVKHIYWEANKYADRLAKLGLSQSMLKHKVLNKQWGFL